MPLDPQWRGYASQLPDARTTRVLNEKKHRLLGNMEPVFCANCGHDGGYVTGEWARHIFYLCDDCVGKHGVLNCPEIPEALLRGRT